MHIAAVTNVYFSIVLIQFFVRKRVRESGPKLCAARLFDLLWGTFKGFCKNCNNTISSSKVRKPILL